MKGYRGFKAVIIGLCAVVATATTAMAQVRDAAHTVTAQGGVYLLDGQPSLVVVNQVRTCPDQPGQTGSSIADSAAAMGINVLMGLSTWCGIDSQSSPTQTTRLNGSLKNQVLWYDQSKGRGPQPSTDVTELVDWQAPLTFAESKVSIKCGSYSSKGLYNEVRAMRGGLFVVNIAVSSPSGGESGYCVTPQRIRNAVMTALAAGAKGFSLITADPVNPTRDNGFSVTGINIAAVGSLMKQVTTMAQVFLGGAPAKATVTGNKDVVTAAWKFKGRTHILTVNTSDQPAKANINIPSLGKIHGKFVANLKPFAWVMK